MVFLVDLRDGKTTVEQVAVDLDKLQGGVTEGRLKAIAKTHDRLAAFLKVCETPR